MSQLYVDNIRNRNGGAIGAPEGVVVTGVTTSTTFDGNVTATTVQATTVNATNYIGVPAGFTELDAALFN